MSLRTRFVVLFTLLAVIPMVGVGVLGYVRTVQAVRALVATQAEEIAWNIARQVAERHASHESDLLLLAANSETQTLFAAWAAADSTALAAARKTALPYLDHAWQVIGNRYDSIELRDSRERVVYRLGGPVTATPFQDPDESTNWSGLLTIREPILDAAGTRATGTVVAAVNPDAVLPYEALEARFGASGYSMVMDRGTGRILYHPRHAYWQRTLGELAGSGEWDIDGSVFDERDGRITYQENDTTRVGFFVSLESPSWTVLAAGSVIEFGVPFFRASAVNLALIVMLALGVATAYALLTRRATRSLVALTAAADRVGGGDLMPSLPDEGQDEVGRLTSAFRLMTGRLRESREQLEASRQMAAVGEFASQISHEIRNPLTSLNLNLQALRREVDAGTIPAELARPVELCLKEVRRLDGVAGGVLSLARPRAAETRPCSLHDVIEAGLEVLRPQLNEAGIDVRMKLQAGRDTVDGDAEALQSVFLNLFLNAVEAMPDGGDLIVSTESTGQGGERAVIRIRVADTGPGISAEAREKIFSPFFSTKRHGTGLGLSLAVRVVEDHRGVLTLAKAGARGRGAEFLVELPLALEEPSA